MGSSREVPGVGIVGIEFVTRRKHRSRPAASEFIIEEPVVPRVRIFGIVLRGFLESRLSLRSDALQVFSTSDRRELSDGHFQIEIFGGAYFE